MTRALLIATWAATTCACALLPGCSTPGSPASDAASEDPLVCSVTAPVACPSAVPGYAADVAPIIERRCLSCHSGSTLGPWPLTAYQHVADWQDMIRSQLLDCTMPPPEAGIPMTNAERLSILLWIRCGLPP